MPATQGMARIGDYTTPVGDANKVAALLALIPNPDSSIGSNGAIAVPAAPRTNSYLDEMSPACAAQLRVEIAALQGAVT